MRGQGISVVTQLDSELRSCISITRAKCRAAYTICSKFAIHELCDLVLASLVVALVALLLTEIHDLYCDLGSQREVGLAQQGFNTARNKMTGVRWSLL